MKLWHLLAIVLLAYVYIDGIKYRVIEEGWLDNPKGKAVHYQLLEEVK